MNPVGMILRGAIRGYQLFISPVLPPSCRFQPSCSAYAMEAIARHGALAGSWLAVQRICRCHPWHDGGYDPVPDVPAHGGDPAPPPRTPDRMS